MCAELAETENAHKDALKELESMRKMMLTMEVERAQMIQEVEDQIRMITVQIDPDSDESRPTSRLSVMSAPGALRKSDSHSHSLRTSNTDATLVESASMGDLRQKDDSVRMSHRTSTVPEVDEPTEDEEVDVSAAKKKRYSASRADFAQDGMAAVDDALSNATAMVNQSISNIQRRVSIPCRCLVDPCLIPSEQLESVVAASRRSQESDSELSEAQGRGSRTRRHRGSRPSSRTNSARHHRLRSITITPDALSPKLARTMSSDSEPSSDLNRSSADETDGTEADDTIVQPIHPAHSHSEGHRSIHKISSNVSALRHDSPTNTASPITPSLTTGTSVATTDDEDTDFQSAYSTSPRGSYGSFENFPAMNEVDESDVATPTTIAKEYVDDFGSRERASSTATAKAVEKRYRADEGVTVVTPTSPTHMR